MKNLFSRSTSAYKSEFETVREAVKNKDWPFLLASILFFAYILLFLCFARPPFNSLYNPIFIVLSLAVIFFCVWRTGLKFNIGVFGVLCYLIIVFAINAAKGIYSLSPLIPPIAILVTYEFASSCRKRENELLLRLVYIALIILLVWSYIRYMPDWIETRDVSIFLDGFFENLDGLTDYFAILFAISLHYVGKKQWESIMVSLASLFFIIASERRTGLLLCLGAIVLFAYFKFGHKNPPAFAIGLAMSLVVALLILILVPQFQSLGDRILAAVQSILTYEGQFAGEPRLALVIRGLVYGFSNFFGAMGYDSIANLLNSTPAHDLIGDLSQNYGGLVGITTVVFFSIIAFKMLFKSRGDRYLNSFYGLFFFLFIFLGTFLYNRAFCFFGGFFAAFSFNSVASPAFPKKRALVVC